MSQPASADQVSRMPLMPDALARIRAPSFSRPTHQRADTVEASQPVREALADHEHGPDGRLTRRPGSRFTSASESSRAGDTR